MWQIFRQVMRKARTAHECVECDRVIKPGETYEYVSGVWDNDFEVIKTKSKTHLLWGEAYAEIKAKAEKESK